MNGYGDSVVWLVAPLIDGYGGQRVYDWPNATRTVLPAAMMPWRSRETDAATEVTTTDKRCHMPPVALSSVHRIEWHGDVYRVEGEPATHYMQGRPDHIEARVVRISEPGT